MDQSIQSLLEILKETTGQAEQELLPFATQWGPQVAAWKAAGMDRPVEELVAAAIMDAASMGVRLQAAGEQFLINAFTHLVT